jgi:glutaredoxin 3
MMDFCAFDRSPASPRVRESQPTAAILYEVLPSITIYTTDPCSFCARVKGILAARGVEYSEVNLSKDPAGRMELVQKTGMMSFPQVLVGDELLGGFAEVQAAAGHLAA